MRAADLLLPRPQRVETPDGALDLRRPAAVHLAGRPTARGPAARGEGQRAFLALCGSLARRGVRIVPADSREGLPVELTVGPVDGLPADAPVGGHELRVDAGGITLRAPTAEGLLQGARTLRQWLDLHDGLPALPALRVLDWPDLAVRGVMLDVSRDKVPTLATLFALVDRLASWKVNQLQLYFEHTFAYRGHERVWAAASPYSAADVRALDAWCAERGVELVPNQNSFGHLHRWLVHEPYRRLAECPEGVEHPFALAGSAPEPYGLCPTDPGSLELLADLYGQLLPCFSSPLLHVGFDETIDLGRGRSAETCRQRGTRRVFQDFLAAVCELAARHDRRPLFWADVPLAAEEAPAALADLRALPGEPLPIAWGYEADHPFERDGARLADAGLAFWLAPGTSSWNSLIGRLGNALGNLASAACAANATGASGMLVTDWGDHGHLQPLPVSLPGLLAGAALAWNADEADRDWSAALPALLDRHAFDRRGDGLGAALCALGRVHDVTGVDTPNASAPFLLLHHAHEELPHPRLAGLGPGGLDAARAALDEASGALAEVAPRSADAAIAKGELSWAAELASWALELGRARLADGSDAPLALAEIDAGTRADLLGGLRPLAQRHRELWLARNRPGGLADSRARLERVAALLGQSAGSST